MSDGRHSVNGAGSDYHSIHGRRSAGKAAAHILKGIGVVGQVLEIGGGFGHFKERGALAGSGEDQVDLDLGLQAQFLEETPAVDGAARSRDPDDDFQAQVT